VSDRGRHRVHESHTLARRAFRLAGLFGVVSAVWAVVVLVDGGSWWGPLHAFLAGAVLMAISGATQMFTITWSASKPVDRRATDLQRWLLAMGVAVVLIGVTLTAPALVWAGAGATTAGLAILAWSLTTTIRRSLLRRFDLSARFYLLALLSGGVGVTLGGVLGSGMAGTGFADMRLVHSHLNLLGLVGLTIVGTLPTFLPTVAHHRAVSGREAKAAWWLGVAGVAVVALGLVFGAVAVGAGTLIIGIAAGSMLAGIVARLWDKGRTRLPFLQVSLGVTWLIAWTALEGFRLLADGPPPPFSTSTGAAVVAGVGQVLVGSLAYLLPVLAGPPLDANEKRMTRRPWIPLVTANAAGLFLLMGWPAVAVAAGAVWVADFGVRLAGLGSNR
jgi:nitrite reductase (NO-forming)